MSSALISEGIKDILVAAGVGIFEPDYSGTGWCIAISRTRNEPNTFIAIYDHGGQAPEPGLDVDYPSIQIVVRGEPDGYKNAMSKCRAIKDVLLGRPSETRSGDVWASITMPTDVIPLGYDDNERPEFSLNFNLIVHQGDLSNSHRSPA